jgi:Cu(I)/Ag(I) efflux system membrane fusion protein
MEKKNIIIGGVTLTIGLLLGYLFFGGSNNNQTSTHFEGDGHNHKDSTQSAEKTIIWTCSMHPQIRKTEPGNCPICGMTLIPADDNSNSNPLVLEMSNDAVKLAEIQTTIIGGKSNQSNIEGTLNLSGKIQADETTTASIVSHIPGRIEKLFISFTGEQVRRGQKIATIYSPNLITAQKELLEAYKVKDVNPSLFEATKNKLKYWKITDQQIDEILNENKVKEYFNIYADHSGVVTKLRVSVGDHLMEGGVLFEIQNFNSLWGIFDAYESDIPKIKLGDWIEFTTPALSNQTFKGKISFIDPVINPKTRAARVRVDINNNNKFLKPEMFINGVLKSKIKQSHQIIIPKTAVLWTGVRSVVYVKVPDTEIPSFEFREITLGENLGQYFVVTSGLKIGEEIVTNGAFVIDAASQLNSQNSMMNRDVIVDKNLQDLDKNNSKNEEMKCDGSMDMDSENKTPKKDDEMKCEAGKCGDGM